MFNFTRFQYLGAQLLRRIGYDFHEEADSRVQDLRYTIDHLDNKAINFNVQIQPDGYWTAESTNLDGIITGGKNPNEASDNIRDAILTYFEVPPYLYKDGLVKQDFEINPSEQKVRVSA